MRLETVVTRLTSLIIYAEKYLSLENIFRNFLPESLRRLVTNSKRHFIGNPDDELTAINIFPTDNRMHSLPSSGNSITFFPEGVEVIERDHLVSGRLSNTFIFE